jgi:hypothetical protein
VQGGWASPDISKRLTEAAISALDAYSDMSAQSLNVPQVRDGLVKRLALTGVYAALRQKGEAA